MRQMLFALGFVVLLVSLSAARNNAAASQTKLPFCPPKSCLYYSGDFDASNPAANGLANVNSLQVGVAQAWVAVKPTRNVTVTGVTFNEAFTTNLAGTNPTPFQINTGMSYGNGGQKFCTSQGTVTVRPYGSPALGLVQYSFTVKRLTPACKLKKGTVYYLNLLPTYNDYNYGYLLDVEDQPAPNHRGWPNVWDDSYFLGLGGDINYWPTWGNNGVCGGLGCDLFSFALTGTKQ